MHFRNTLPFFTAILAAACGAEQPLQPVGDDGAQPQMAVLGQGCRPSSLASETAGDVTSGDCLFEEAGDSRREDLYIVGQGRLGRSDRSGSSMLTFTAEADFDAIFGLGEMDGQPFPDPVYGYSRFAAGSTGTWGNSFSMIGSDPVYRMWFGGQSQDQLGAYSLSAGVEPSIDSCESGHWVFLQGSGTFSSDISNDASCRGTIEFGPNAGLPLNFQFWYVKLQPGETFSATLAGASDPTVALAAIDFGTGHAELDLSDGLGDSDRAVRFTADRQLWLYVEVSSAPDVVSSYAMSFEGP